MDIQDIHDAMDVLRRNPKGDLGYFENERAFQQAFKQALRILEPHRRMEEEVTLEYRDLKDEPGTTRVDLWLPDEGAAIELKYLKPPDAHVNLVTNGFQVDCIHLGRITRSAVRGRFAVLLSCFRQHWMAHFVDGSDDAWGASWTDFSHDDGIRPRARQTFRYLAVHMLSIELPRVR